MSDRVIAPGGPWICTFTGRAFFPLAPRAEDVDILDVAHALSMKCRFNGHVREFYSVAEHSVRVALRLRDLGYPRDVILAGLAHDGEEAYLPDVPKPVKREIKHYWTPIACRVQLVVNARFGLSADAHTDPRVHEADRVLLATEKRDLMPRTAHRWGELPDPLAEVIEPMSPQEAEREFLFLFYQLWEKS